MKQVTISAPLPQPSPRDYGADNLVKNLSVRSSGTLYKAVLFNNLTVYQQVEYETCYKTTSDVLGDLGNIMEVTFDLGETFFVHAILIVQDLLYDGADK